MNKLKNNTKLKSLVSSQTSMIVLLIILISIFTTIFNSNFLTWINIQSILSQATSLGLVAAGATILIISGHFDVSLGSMIGLSTCVMAIMINAGVSLAVVCLVGILLCVTCSLLNGAMSILFKAPSFIVTLATGSLYYGIALIVTNGYMQTIFGKFEFLGSYKIFGVIPFLLIILVLAYIIMYVVFKFTRTGRQAFAIGTNEKAAFLSGININRSKLKFFAISGMLVGVASLILLSRVSSAQPSSGAGMELEAIGAVVIGGTAINGGKGGVIGTFFGVLLLSMISSAINMLHISAYYQDIIYGMIILIALSITAVRSRVVAKK